jgi:hypothetical protein
MVVPAQALTLAGAVMVGRGLTVTVDIAVAVQPLAAVTVTVYGVVAVGLAVTEAAFVGVKLVVGDHE